MVAPGSVEGGKADTASSGGFEVMSVGPEFLAAGFGDGGKVQGIRYFQAMPGPLPGGAIEAGVAGGYPLLAWVGKEAVRMGKSQSHPLFDGFLPASGPCGCGEKESAGSAFPGEVFSGWLG
ncbi:MAG: hypothetical protein WBH99_03310 [Azovibrio sp.]|uniref:hypothetical protein n=1 Tax=Azovibrio sp. TaxID=1872673 RepID=UPI003C724F99